MKKNGRHGVAVRIAGSGLAVAALLALALSNPRIGRAQSTTASAAPAVTRPQATTAAPVSPAHQPSAKGQHEGVKVHGHWTIEVRNPDGKLVSHTEFENALVQPGGAENLAAMLLGGAVVGGYVIDLGSDTTGLKGPCATNTQVTGCFLVGSLISPEPAAFGDNSSGCGGTGYPNQITPTGPCFPLSISPVSNTGLAFGGTAVADTTTSITDVFLNPTVCYSNSLFSPASSAISPNSCAQGWPEETEVSGLTHATLPTPVTISAVGQLISVNVQLSFQ